MMIIKGGCFMKAFMTTGTLNFLEKIADKHDNYSFFLMVGPSNTLAYYEGNKKNVFAAGRAYDILTQHGNILDEGYVVMNHIPVTSEGMPIFENHLKKREAHVSALHGLHAFRLLKPTKGYTYIILTQWQSADHYEAWRETEDFQEILGYQAMKQPAYFAARPYGTSYHMYIEDEVTNDD